MKNTHRLFGKRLCSFCMAVLFLFVCMTAGCGGREKAENESSPEAIAVETGETAGSESDTLMTETAVEPLTESETETETETETEEEDPLIIVLDPGHDSEYCTRNQPQLGVNEQDLNLTIGLACYERLSSYKGVKVYLTREDGSCPDADEDGVYCIERRTGIATDLGADLFVSLHCNATTGSLGASANGAEVYVSNYSAYTEEGKKLGEIILDKLEDFDIRSNGVIVRTKAEKGHYDDGSVQDWYYLISYSVEGGHPGIIIEHAYMDNTHDNAILRDDEKLKAIGEADADAIAEYYGLELR